MTQTPALWLRLLPLIRLDYIIKWIIRAYSMKLTGSNNPTQSATSVIEGELSQIYAVTNILEPGLQPSLQHWESILDCVLRVWFCKPLSEHNTSLEAVKWRCITLFINIIKVDSCLEGHGSALAQKPFSLRDPRTAVLSCILHSPWLGAFSKAQV